MIAPQKLMFRHVLKLNARVVVDIEELDDRKVERNENLKGNTNLMQDKKL